MTIAQGFAFGIVAAMMALFAWGRIRYDAVALLALLASAVTGIVPAKEAFTGFADDVVVIVASALVVSAAVARSGIIERILVRIAPRLQTVQMQVVVLVGVVTALSALVKNIGALAMLIPVAFQLARRAGTPPSAVLMPLSFGSLLGGLMTLIGTSPNIIVSRMREEIVGEPFRMFDFLPVGGGIALLGIIFLAFGYRLLPGGRRGAVSMEAALTHAYMTEAVLPEDSPFVGRTVAEIEAAGEGAVTVITIIRERFRRYTPAGDWTLIAGDVLLLEGEPAALNRLVAQAKLKLARADEAAAEPDDPEETEVVEAVVRADSPAIDRSPAQLRMAERFRVEILAISRSGERLTHRLRATKLREGDLIVARGQAADLPDAFAALQFLPLAGRDIRFGTGGNGLIPIATLACAMVAVAFQLVPVAIAFFAASVLLIATRSLTLRQAYEAIDGPIIVLLAALIPVSEAIRTTGGTDLLAGWIALAAQALPGLGAVALIMVIAMAVTPFLNNAATVLMMAPIAASLAASLGYRPDAFLMAVAIGAASDFLTPFGHQCNTLVLGPGGYRFGDYWRLGLPLSFLVIAAGVPLIAVFWPL